MVISTQTQAAVALAELRRTEGVTVTTSEVEAKAALDALVDNGLAYHHKYGAFHYYEPAQALPEAFVPWPYKLYELPADDARRVA